MSAKTAFFMGANTPGGFVSLFDELYNPSGTGRCYIIKGGPGTGKSSFMKRLAEKAENLGHSCEYIYCASDPSSLDGIIIPSLEVCFADGTSPHVIEPKYPGAVEQLVNLGDCWDGKPLRESRDEIRELYVRNSALHAASIRYLAAAGALLRDGANTVLPLIDEAKVRSFAFRFARRELPRLEKSPGRATRRFLSAVTPKGVFCHSHTVRVLCSRVIGIEDQQGVASGLLLERLESEAILNGYDVISCPCPLNPKGRPEHLLIPKAGLAVVTLKQAHSLELTPDRVIHAQRFTDTSELYDHKNRLAFIHRAAWELTQEAARLMSEAKKVHDSLEAHYIKAMDFQAVGKIYDKLEKEVFGFSPER